MTENLDKDLQDLLGNLGGEGGGGESGGMDLDAALDAMGGESAAGESAGGDAGGMDLDAALNAMGGESAGGGSEPAGADLDAALNAMREDEPAPKPKPKPAKAGRAAKAAAPAPAPQPRVEDSLVGVEHTRNLDYLLDIKLNITFEVGRAKMQVADLLTLGQGSVIELHRLVGDELDLLINGRLVAKGAVVVVNEKFGCKVTEIISPEQRIKHMGV